MFVLTNSQQKKLILLTRLNNEQNVKTSTKYTDKIVELFSDSECYQIPNYYIEY